MSCCTQDDLTFLYSMFSGSFGQFGFVSVLVVSSFAPVTFFAFVFFLNPDGAEHLGNSFCMPIRASQVVTVVLCASPCARSQYSAIHVQPCHRMGFLVNMVFVLIFYGLRHQERSQSRVRHNSFSCVVQMRSTQWS